MKRPLAYITAPWSNSQYQIGTLITTGSFGAGFLPGLIVVAMMATIVISLVRNANKQLTAEYALSERK